MYLFSLLYIFHRPQMEVYSVEHRHTIGLTAVIQQRQAANGKRGHDHVTVKHSTYRGHQTTLIQSEVTTSAQIV